MNLSYSIISFLWAGDNIEMEFFEVSKNRLENSTQIYLAD